MKLAILLWLLIQPNGCEPQPRMVMLGDHRVREQEELRYERELWQFRTERDTDGEYPNNECDSNAWLIVDQTKNPACVLRRTIIL